MSEPESDTVQHEEEVPYETGTRTDHSSGGFWGKLEIMGHEMYYGYVREAQHVDGGVAIDILPSNAGELDASDPNLHLGLHTKEFGPNAIFGVEPIGREEAVKLAGRSHYEASPLDYSEQSALVEGKYELDEAIDTVEAADYSAVDNSQVEAQALAVARVAAVLHLVDVSEGAEKLQRRLVSTLENALDRTIPLGKAKGLIQQYITELDEADDRSPDALHKRLSQGIEVDFDEPSEMTW